MDPCSLVIEQSAGAGAYQLLECNRVTTVYPIAPRPLRRPPSLWKKLFIFFLRGWCPIGYCSPVASIFGDALEAMVACCQRFLWA